MTSPFLLVPAFSLAFVGLVQGAACPRAACPPRAGSPPTRRGTSSGRASAIGVRIFQGMPVGGSMSGSSLIVAGGAKTRLAFIFAGAVMAL